MKLKYKGPREAVKVDGFGAHKKGETREYPANIAAEILRTSKRQRFEAVEDKKPSQAQKGRGTKK